ncbi:MAG TPA: hypothetical protein VHM26_02195, partial [Chitinophagaceae bacterium]|nr:hypothetical protein [Chitinophagaceae bacterium]
LIMGKMASSQEDSTSNSFAATYSKTHPDLKYVYDVAHQTHDYSGNWDFDKDGKTDDVLFVGTGGAHIYFYLRIVLSSDKVVRNYTHLNLDFPMLPGVEELSQPNILNQFTVVDANLDGHNDILISLDKFSLGSNWLKKHHLSSNTILITFKGTNIAFRNYPVSRQ